MKQIIEGKAYNTETAELIGTEHNGHHDFRKKSESLYKTAKGNFFLHGIGGAMTEYGEDYGDGRSGGSKLIPMSEQEAFKWAQLNLQTDITEKYFSQHIEEA
jgi:hypothetical protein